jgi:hypothetical protein
MAAARRRGVECPDEGPLVHGPGRHLLETAASLLHRGRREIETRKTLAMAGTLRILFRFARSEPPDPADPRPLAVLFDRLVLR